MQSQTVCAVFRTNLLGFSARSASARRTVRSDVLGDARGLDDELLSPSLKATRVVSRSPEYKAVEHAAAAATIPNGNNRPVSDGTGGDAGEGGPRPQTIIQSRTWT